MTITIAGMKFDVEFDFATDTGPEAIVSRRENGEVLCGIPSHWEDEIREGIAEELVENGEISDWQFNRALGRA